MKQRMISMLLGICMVFAVIPTGVFAAEAGTPGGTGGVADSGEPAACSCDSLCTSESMNGECAVCGAEGANLAGCKGEATVALAVPRNVSPETITTTLDLTGIKHSVKCTDGSGGGSNHAHGDSSQPTPPPPCWKWDYDATNGSTLTLNNVDIEASSGYAIHLPEDAKINFSGTNRIKGATKGIVAKGDLEIDGSGSFTAAGGQETEGSEGISADRGELTLKGENAEYTIAEGTVTGGGYAICASKITLQCAKVTATADNFQIFSSKPTLIGMVHDDDTTDWDRTGTCIYIKGTADIAEINGVGYATLQKAIDAVTEGQTIKLLKDADETIDTKETAKSFILDLNGKALRNNATAISHKNTGTLTIKNGAVEGQGQPNILNGSTGTITLQNVTVTTTTHDSDGAAISNGSTGIINISGGKVQSLGKNVCAIWNAGSGKISISNGAVITSQVSGTGRMKGTIHIDAVPTSNPKTVLEIQDTVSVSNTAAAGNQYAVYFAPTSVTTDNVGDYYTKADTATVDTVYAKPVTTYTITYDANGGTVSPTSATTIDGKLSSLPIPTRSGSYRFDGWFTASSGGTQVTTATVFTKDSTIYAHWTYTGGSSSDDNDSGIAVTPTPANKPSTPTEGTIKLESQVDNGGNATVNLTAKNINDAYNKALADARRNGNSANGIALVLNVNTGNKIANSLTVNLPKAVQDTIIGKRIVNTLVVVDNPDIKIDMDLAAVKEISKQARADVSITATKQDNAKLTGDAKAAIGSRPVFDLAVNYGSGKQVTNFGAGSVAVEIPYALGTNEKAGNIYAVYVDESGKAQWLTSSVYDSVNKVIRFSTNHFSTYGVGYKAVNTNFTDITNHWAKESIEFAAARGLFGGTTDGKFNPNGAVTQKDMLTALNRLSGTDQGKAFSNYSANAQITREQMAVIMANYAKAIGFTLPKVHAKNTFADNAKISSYAAAAVKQMQMAGVISGKDGNKFEPQGTATRAEASAVLKRFVELMISSNTAQGWTQNDSGALMYYENGKPVTDKKTIDGTTYTFDKYGVVADVPKNRKYGTYIVQNGDSFWLIAYKQGCTVEELEILNTKSRLSLIHPGDELIVPEK